MFISGDKHKIQYILMYSTSMYQDVYWKRVLIFLFQLKCTRMFTWIEYWAFLIWKTWLYFDYSATEILFSTAGCLLNLYPSRPKVSLKHFSINVLNIGSFYLRICFFFRKIFRGHIIFIIKTRSSNIKQAPNQTIILGLQIFLDHWSLSSIGQKILMILPPPPKSFETEISISGLYTRPKKC